MSKWAERLMCCLPFQVTPLAQVVGARQGSVEEFAVLLSMLHLL